MHKLTLSFSLFMMIAHLALSQNEGEGISYPVNNELQEEYVQLYPRPATTFLEVKLQEPHARVVKLVVRSLIGNIIDVDREYADDYRVRLKVQDLPSGYYFISIKDEETGWRATYRFLKR